MTPLSHSTRRVVLQGTKCAVMGFQTRRPEHESDVTPYVPLAHRQWDADSETMQPVRAGERE